jgi:hypothetical protein
VRARAFRSVTRLSTHFNVELFRTWVESYWMQRVRDKPPWMMLMMKLPHYSLARDECRTSDQTRFHYTIILTDNGESVFDLLLSYRIVFLIRRPLDFYKTRTLHEILNSTELLYCFWRDGADLLEGFQPSNYRKSLNDHSWTSSVNLPLFFKR